MHKLVVAESSGVCHIHTNSEQISELIKNPDNVIWLDVVNPSPQDLQLLGNELHFHPLAVEDAHHFHSRPKIDSYDGYYFAVFYALAFHAKPEPAVSVNQIALFIGRNYLVTVHTRAIAEVDETLRRWREHHDVVGHHVGAVVYNLLDAIVDNYFPVMDQIAESIEDLEEEIFTHYTDSAQGKIFALKKELLNVRRVVTPSRDVLNILLRRDRPIFNSDVIVYFQDVYDHIVRVTDSIDTYRELLASALDSHLSITSNRMNQTMRVMTASSIVLMSMSLIAGIYGMNFAIMPELQWQNGYILALLAMLATGTTIFYLFRRRGWL
jgi:magnesium transporter